MRRFDLAVTIVCCALLGYFAWHAWKGPRGYPYREALEAKVDVLQQKHGAAEQTRKMLENKVALLRPESIDPDLLDEMARDRLQMAKPSDVVAFTAP